MRMILTCIFLTTPAPAGAALADAPTSQQLFRAQQLQVRATELVQSAQEALGSITPFEGIICNTYVAAIGAAAQAVRNLLQIVQEAIAAGNGVLLEIVLDDLFDALNELEDALDGLTDCIDNGGPVIIVGL